MLPLYTIVATFRLRFAYTVFPPTYRIYVGPELFAERTYDFADPEYLEEILTLKVPAGKYVIRVESTGEYKAWPVVVKSGAARVMDDFTIVTL